MLFIVDYLMMNITEYGVLFRIHLNFFISSLIIIFLATKRRQAVRHDQTYYEIFVKKI